MSRKLTVAPDQINKEMKEDCVAFLGCERSIVEHSEDQSRILDIQSHKGQPAMDTNPAFGQTSNVGQ